MDLDSILSLPDADVPGSWLMFVLKTAAGLSLLIYAYQVFAPKNRILLSDGVGHETKMESLRDRARDLSEHADERDLSARLHDSLHASGEDPFAEPDEPYLPGLGPMPTEWREPEAPEAPR
ncbi:MAG: hypothetical protein AAFQ43_07600 [Bacteroidota bacterium]